MREQNWMLLVAPPNMSDQHVGLGPFARVLFCFSFRSSLSKSAPWARAAFGEAERQMEMGARVRAQLALGSRE